MHHVSPVNDERREDPVAPVVGGFHDEDDACAERVGVADAVEDVHVDPRRVEPPTTTNRGSIPRSRIGRVKHFSVVRVRRGPGLQRVLYEDARTRRYSRKGSLLAGETSELFQLHRKEPRKTPATYICGA